MAAFLAVVFISSLLIKPLHVFLYHTHDSCLSEHIVHHHNHDDCQVCNFSFSLYTPQKDVKLALLQETTYIYLNKGISQIYYNDLQSFVLLRAPPCC